MIHFTFLAIISVYLIKQRNEIFFVYSWVESQIFRVRFFLFKFMFHIKYFEVRDSDPVYICHY